jgi:Major Facilitator Superfamily
MNLPFGILGLILATWLMPNMQDERVGPLDVKGFVLSGLGLSLTVFGMTELGQGIFPPYIIFGMIAAGAILIWVYVRHAQRTKHPILDLSMLRVQTLRVSIMGGMFYRVSAGAVPFLLPLMLQLGFGFTPFQSGSITCASALGAVMMKFLAAKSLRRWGYRQLLVFNGITSSMMMAINGLFMPTTPFFVMMLVLLMAGLLRSLQFTSLNSIAYADVTSEEVGRANGLYTVAQQLSLALGVAVAALVLEASQSVRGVMVLGRTDFAVAFFVVAAVGLMSTFFFVKLPANAGKNLSGHLAA